MTVVLLLTAGSVVQEKARAEWRYRRVQYNYNSRPAPPTNHAAKAKEPEETPVKFKDLAINTEFYFLADKSRKLFPRVKISNTAAKTVPTAANPKVTTNSVPAELLVIKKKDVPKKDGDKRDQDGKKDNKKS